MTSALVTFALPSISIAGVYDRAFKLQNHESRRGRQTSTTITRASKGEGPKNNNNKNNLVPVTERIISASTYFLPFLDGFQYGRFVATQFPAVGAVLQPLIPLIRAYRGVPYASIVVFFGLYFGVVRNRELSRYVRFNAMQAIVLDVLLIVPDIVDRSFGSEEAAYGVSFLSSLDSTVFLFLLMSLLYGSGSCLLGQIPRLPLVADAADAQDIRDGLTGTSCMEENLTKDDTIDLFASMKERISDDIMDEMPLYYRE